MTMPLFQILAAMTLGEKLADAFTVAVVGMGTVFVALWLIGEVFTLLHRFFERREGGHAIESEAQSGDQAPAEVSATDSHLVPILVAATTAALGRRVVVRRIKFINRNTISGWAEAGRAEIQSSHNIRRRM